MNISKFVVKNTLSLKVIPSSGRTELKEDDGKLKLYLKSPPEKGKANAEVIKFFKKEYNISVRIKSGASSREKVLEIVS